MYLPKFFLIESNLFLIELIFKCPEINSSGKRFLISFSPIFASIILLQEQYLPELIKCFPESLKLLQSNVDAYLLARLL